MPEIPQSTPKSDCGYKKVRTCVTVRCVYNRSCRKKNLTTNKEDTTMALSDIFGWDKQEKKNAAPAAACGSACGASEKPEEKPAACGAGDKK